MKNALPAPGTHWEFHTHHQGVARTRAQLAVGITSPIGRSPETDGLPIGVVRSVDVQVERLAVDVAAPELPAVLV